MEILGCGRNLIILVHLFSLLEVYSCGMVIELIMLNAFIFIATAITTSVFDYY
jgi:hypothetical protein